MPTTQCRRVGGAGVGGGVGIATVVAGAAVACLLGDAAAAAAAAAAAVDELDAIIIGAGWAGMGAAHALALANQSFVVLESTNRTGGRSHALAGFGDPTIWNGVVERGSNWVSGVAPPGVVKGGAAGVAKGLEDFPSENPVHVLAREHGLQMVRIPGSADGNMTDYNAIYSSDGNINGDPDYTIRKAAQKALDCLNETWARREGKGVTVREGLRHCGWVPRSEEEYAMDWAMSGEDANGEPARNESLRSFDPDASYSWWGPDDQFVIDQHPRGFARLIDGMVHDTVPPGDPRVLFNATAATVNYDCEGVEVSTADGRIFRAKQVISTLPLGVLHHHHKEIFHPPIPPAQAKMLTPESGYRMGNLTHVVIQFPTVWWDDAIPKWLASNPGSNVSSEGGGPDGAGPAGAGEFSLWHNLNHKKLLPGSQTLLTFLGDPQSSVYEDRTRWTDAALKAHVVSVLKRQHPDLADKITVRDSSPLVLAGLPSGPPVAVLHAPLGRKPLLAQFGRVPTARLHAVTKPNAVRSHSSAVCLRVGRRSRLTSSSPATDTTRIPTAHTQFPSRAGPGRARRSCSRRSRRAARSACASGARLRAMS
eukprot:COSAG06_NODE_23_length_33072_cov_44.622327_15_plen_593_part_00